MLLLHGFTGAKEDFTEWLDKLADRGWHAIAPDHRGHGVSSKPTADAAYSIATLANDALALVDVLGWDNFALLGHSMGGFVAQRVALTAPSRLDALVLMDTSHEGIKGLDTTQAGLAVKIVREQGMDALADLMANRASPLETPSHRRLLAERPGYAEFGDRKLRATSPHLYAAVLPELLRHADMLEELAALQPPPRTLVLVGEQDTPLLGPSKRLADAVPGAALVIIPDAGHSPQFENPAGWWQALSSFLAGIES